MSGSIAVARPTQALRLRRESQRPSVARSATRQSTMEHESPKQDIRRFGATSLSRQHRDRVKANMMAVYTAEEILARHKGKQPSIRVYLHPSHFRINDSADTLSYSSPLRSLLAHIRTRTIPHDIVDELYDIQTPFYDNCLIVEVHDHRSTGVKPRDDTNSLGESGNNAYSIHNYNNFITPSPHVPYPTVKGADSKAKSETPAKDVENKDDKENMPAPNQASSSQKQPARSKINTVVLFPTPQSHLTDIQLLATTPVPDMAALKRMQAAGRATGMPPTPMTGVPPTPTYPTGPSPKRQKMILDDSNVYEFESELLNATCPKLYLEPTRSLPESLAIMEAITHPNNKNEPPARKTRKRTTAELAADEAEAADMQRFMLAGDEQQANIASTVSGEEGASRAAANSNTFSRFKTLTNIKANHEEAERRKKEEDARLAQAKRQAQIEAEAQKRRDMESNRQAAEMMERQQQQQQQMLLRQQASQQQMQQNQLQQNEALRAATQAQQIQMNNNNAAQMSQTPQSATQAQFSPVVRNGTPMANAASPRVNGQVSNPMGGTPMVATASNHAINSPARPPSAVQHQQMARSASQQQNLSRTGTPQMIQGTPVMNSAMPNRNMTPTPMRMSQSSPSMNMQGGTPMMMQTPQPGQNMTPEMQQQQQMQQRMLQQQQQMRAQGVSPGNNQIQQIALQKANQYIQQNGVPPGNNPQQYLNGVARRFLQQLQQQQLQQNQAAMQNMSPQGMQQNVMPAQQPMQNMTAAQLRQMFQGRRQQLMQQYGNNIPQQEVMRLKQLENAYNSKNQQEQNQMQQMGMQNQMQNQMQQNQMQGQMNGIPNNIGQNPMQMQAYQQMLQQQRAQQARNNQMMAMRQQAMQQGGQLPQGMMNNVNMQGMNMGQMGQMNMGNMQGMNMQNLQQMQQMQQMGQMNPQQVQQMMMMRQAQQQANQRMGQPGQGGGDMGWNG